MKRTWTITWGVFPIGWALVLGSIPAEAQIADPLPSEQDAAGKTEQDSSTSTPEAAGPDHGNDTGPLQGGVTDKAILIEDSEPKPWNRGIPIDRRRQAKAIFRRANQQFRDGNPYTAVDSYLAAIAVWQHPAFYYNLARVQAATLNQPLQAYRSIQQAIRYGAEPLGPEKYETAQRLWRHLSEQVGHLVVRCSVPGARVLLNGQPVLTEPGRHQEVLLTGSYQIDTYKTGHISDTERFVLAAGQRKEYICNLRYRVTKRYVPRWVSWGAMAFGALGLAGGGYFHWRAHSAADAFDTAVTNVCPTGCPPEEQALSSADLDQRNQANDWTSRADRAYIAGGLVLAGGVVLLFINRERTEVRSVGHDMDNLSFGPVLTPDTVGMSASFHF